MYRIKDANITTGTIQGMIFINRDINEPANIPIKAVIMKVSEVMNPARPRSDGSIKIPNIRAVIAKVTNMPNIQ